MMRLTYYHPLRNIVPAGSTCTAITLDSLQNHAALKYHLVVPLIKLQKRAARMILKADFMTPSEQLFKELNWIPLPKRVQSHTCLIVYKSSTGQAPEYISSMLTYVSEHHERPSLDLLHIPRSNSAFFDRAFSVQGPKLWNSLPAIH